MEIQWSLVLFTVLTGTAGWGMAGLAVEEVRGKVGKEGFLLGLILLIVMAVGGCVSVTHLSHPENMLAALTHPTSGIFIEAALIGVTGVASIVYLILKKRQAAAAVNVFAVIAGAFGVILSFMAGESYVVASQPAWNTLLMPLGYCLTVAPAGIALYLMMASVKAEPQDSVLLGAGLGAAGILGALAALAWGVASGFIADMAAAIGISVVGALVASLLGFFSRSGKKVWVFALIALLCALIGAIAYRYGMWSVGYGINNFFGSI